MDLTVVVALTGQGRDSAGSLVGFHAFEIPPDVRITLLVVPSKPGGGRNELETTLGRLSGDGMFERVELVDDVSRIARAVRGDLTLWTEEGVTVGPSWVGQYLEAAQSCPDLAYFGGSVQPCFVAKAPGWVTRNLGSLQAFLALKSLDQDPEPTPGFFSPSHANMAIRTSVLRNRPPAPCGLCTLHHFVYGPFTDFFRDVALGGGRGGRMGSTVAYRTFAGDQLTIRALKDWYFLAGAAAAESHPRLRESDPNRVLRCLWEEILNDSAFDAFFGGSARLKYRKLTSFVLGVVGSFGGRRKGSRGRSERPLA